MVAEEEIVADGDAGRPELDSFFEKARRVDHDAVSNNGADSGPEYSDRQKREFVSSAVANDGVAGIGSAVEADDPIMLIGEKIDNLTLGLVAPLKADNTGADHSLRITCLGQAACEAEGPGLYGHKKCPRPKVAGGQMLRDNQRMNF